MCRHIEKWLRHHKISYKLQGQFHSLLILFLKLIRSSCHHLVSLNFYQRLVVSFEIFQGKNHSASLAQSHTFDTMTVRNHDVMLESWISQGVQFLLHGNFINISHGFQVRRYFSNGFQVRRYTILKSETSSFEWYWITHDAFTDSGFPSVHFRWTLTCFLTHFLMQKTHTHTHKELHSILYSGSLVHLREYLCLKKGKK